MENTQIAVVNQSQYVVTEKELKSLVDAGIIPKGTPPEQAQIFAKVCNEKGLSPFSKQIYLMARYDKRNNTTRYTIQTGIDGFRSLAERTGCYAGSDDYLFDEGLNVYQMLHNKRNTPTTATATVYKIVKGIRVPFTTTIVVAEYKPGAPNDFMWNKMPFLMPGKCAEALALRKAFPEQLSGVYSDDEMQQADTPIQDIPKQPQPDKKAEQKTAVITELKSLQPVESVPAEDDIFSKCKTLRELVKVWNSLTKANKPQHEASKNKRKAELIDKEYFELQENISQAMDTTDLNSTWKDYEKSDLKKLLTDEQRKDVSDLYNKYSVRLIIAEKEK